MQEGFSLPFDNNEHSVRISQGYNGPWSHRAFLMGEHKRLGDYRYSVDFELPYNTQVLAACDGTVYGVEDTLEDYYGGLDFITGMNTFANFMMLKHEDENYSVYYHLSKDSSKVRKEEKVIKGQSIALTGRSGWIGNAPHLHFAVFEF